ncbi:uncharacterized protein COLE_01505 [Cutaneotrichosporon oleaginosum]|uniref:uncharacterized protein n=1 Tax=Cutaneotrichosporon oleaginosum TaxID=879819 RepID=UPI001321630C|nr:hypothetical protein COLE_01505 [Cutaneotrichosporon oleaginosum]
MKGPYGQPVAPNLSVRHLCPNCRTDPPHIVEEYSHGDLVCADCGTILGDRIVDTRSECETFAGDEGGDDPSRVGGPSNPLLGNASLDTIISGRDGRTGMSKDLMRAQNRANQQSATGGGKSNALQLQSAFARISEKTDAMQLPRKVTEIAQHAYKIGDEQRISRGRNDDALIAASIVFATRMAGAQRSFTEVCKVTRVSKSELGRVFKLLKSAIDKTGTAPKGNTNTSDVVESLLGRFSNYLDLGVMIHNSSKHIAPLAMRLPTIDGRTPNAIAAGVLFFTTTLMEKQTTSKEIAGISNVSESTIKMICKKVAEELDQVIKPEWKEQFPKGYKDVESLGSKNLRAAVQTSRAGTPAQSGANTPAPST